MHPYRVIAVSTLTLLASALLHAQSGDHAAPRAAAAQAAARRHSSSARAPLSAPSAAHAPAPGGMRPAATAARVSVRPTATAAIALPPRSNLTGAPFGSARARPAPANAALGGPATFDARKLVRR